jgi:type IV pilus assembly protein PilO
MARTDLVGQLAKKPPAFKAAVLAGVMAFFGILYWQFFYSGLKDQKAGEIRAKNKAQKDAKKYDEQLKEMKKLTKRNEELQKTIRANQRALPTEAELPAFFEHLQRKAGEAGVKIDKWDRKKEKSISDYVKVPVEIHITGNFYQIMRYFSLLGPPVDKKEAADIKPEGDDADGGDDAEPDGDGVDASSVNERIVSIENLFLGDAKVRNDEVILTARFFASTYRQRESAKPPPKKAAAKKDAKSGSKVGAAKKKQEDKVKDKTSDRINKRAGGAP